MLVPPRVVEVTMPPQNCPRATSYALVTTRTERSASCGMLAVPRATPSSITALAAGRWPATENAVALESVPAMPITPG